MCRHGERLRTPKECRENRFMLKAVLSTLNFDVSNNLSLRTEYKAQSTRFRANAVAPSGRVKQARPFLSALDSEMLISKLRRHAAARRAIKEADLNQIWLDDLFY